MRNLMGRKSCGSSGRSAFLYGHIYHSCRLFFQSCVVLLKYKIIKSIKNKTINMFNKFNLIPERTSLGLMLFLLKTMNLSRSGRLISCGNPIACMNSWITDPTSMQPPFRNKTCLPPCMPMSLLHLHININKCNQKSTIQTIFKIENAYECPFQILM